AGPHRHGAADGSDGDAVLARQHRRAELFQPVKSRLSQPVVDAALLREAQRRGQLLRGGRGTSQNDFSHRVEVLVALRFGHGKYVCNWQAKNLYTNQVKTNIFQEKYIHKSCIYTLPATQRGASGARPAGKRRLTVKE